MVTIHPGLVLGPALTTASKSGSMTTMKAFIDCSLAGGAPDLAFGLVDVRDVARAHVTGGVHPGRARSLHHQRRQPDHARDRARSCASASGTATRSRYTRCPRRRSDWSRPSPGYSREFVDKNVGYPLEFDNTRSREELGITYRDMADTVVGPVPADDRRRDHPQADRPLKRPSVIGGRRPARCYLGDTVGSSSPVQVQRLSPTGERPSWPPSFPPLSDCRPTTRTVRTAAAWWPAGDGMSRRAPRPDDAVAGGPAVDRQLRLPPRRLGPERGSGTGSAIAPAP